MGRPDLTYLTQSGFHESNSKSYIFDKNDNTVLISDVENEQYFKAISKLPELVQCAEMLFDMTLDKPNSIIHKMVSDLLNELKEEK